MLNFCRIFFIKCTISNDQFKKIIAPDVKVVAMVLLNLMVTTRFARVS